MTSIIQGGFNLKDENGLEYGVKHVNNKPRVSSMPYLYDIAEENITDHEVWTKIGFTPTMTTAVSDIWSGAGLINFPVSARGMEVYCNNNTNDKGTAIFSGNSTSGTATDLDDTGKNFTAGTPVAIGDCILLDTTKEIGFVTAVAATKLTCSGGFSKGGSGASQAYRVIDYSAYSGAQVVEIGYLDSSYAEQSEFVITSGNTPVPTVSTDILRVNSFSVVVAGSTGLAAGYITLRDLDVSEVPIYSYISAMFTRARNIAYTVPAGKTLYITTIIVAYGYSTNQTHYCRIFTRATQNKGFRTPGIFYPFTEVIVANTSQLVELSCPTKLIEKVDLKVSGIATFSGIATVALRGWIE